MENYCVLKSKTANIEGGQIDRPWIYGLLVFVQILGDITRANSAPVLVFRWKTHLNMYSVRPLFCPQICHIQIGVSVPPTH